jgi:hypothetical protein
MMHSQGGVTPGWTLHFVSMKSGNAFGFVDPKDICGCHIIPNFTEGKQHADGVGISRWAKDGKDYSHYYVGR